MLSKDQTTDFVQRLVPFPSFGYLDADGLWRLNISGIARQPYSPSLRKRMLIKILGNVMHATDVELASPKFRERVTSFVMDGAHGLEVHCSIGGREFELTKRTRRNGHFFGWIALEPAFIEKIATGDGRGLRSITAHIRVDRTLEDTASVQLIPRRGISVVSDIDDTIKESSIGDRRELLANTFLREFRSVEGMSQVYRQWFEAGIPLHYVSSSPWQLLPWIEEMIRTHQFPSGSLHLRNFRLRNHMLQKVIRFRRSGKIAAIRMLIKKFPQRQFLFVGDSSEKDLEIYHKIARQNPNRVSGIFIREVPLHPIARERLDRCREALNGVRVSVFQEPRELFDLTTGIIHRTGP